MKRFTDSFGNGGIPFYNEDWNTAQKEPLKAAESIVAGLLEPCIISGGEITNITPTISIEPGYAFLNGKIMPFDAITNQPYGYLIEDTGTVETRFLQDGGSAPFSTESKAIYSATPAGGLLDSIDLNQYPYQYLNQVKFRQSTPKGTILMLSSSTSDLFGFNINNFDAVNDGSGTGWYKNFHLCNGNNGTINLTDKFIKGADLGASGSTGGQSTIDLRHNHEYTTATADSDTTSYDVNGNVTDGLEPTTVTPGGTPVLSIPSGRVLYTDNRLNNNQNIEPPYYTLYYMQRV